MNKILWTALVVLALTACSSPDDRPTTALETGREFIRASLNGDFKRAELLMVKDTQNVQLFDSYKRYYNKLPDDQKQNYRNASYEINKYDELDDSTMIINYSNTYMKRPMDIKIIRSNQQWSVDFKYTYSGTNQME